MAASAFRHPLDLRARAGLESPRRFLDLPEAGTLAYSDEGEGRPVVLIHGVLTALEDMTLSLGPALGPGRRLLAFDRPGFGHSQVRRFLDAGLWRQADRLLDALRILRLEGAVVVGHSFGASVALAMAATAPEVVGGVVAIAPLAFPEPRLEHLLFGPRTPPVLGELAGFGAGGTLDRGLLPLLWRSMFLPQAMPPQIEKAFPFALAGRADATLRTGEDAMVTPADLMRLLAVCGRCPVPVRIFGGDRDLVVNNLLHGAVLGRLMPNAAFEWLSGLGHMAHHFAPQVIAEAVAAIEARARASSVIGAAA